MKNLFTLILLMSLASASQAAESKSADAQAVNAACAQESATAGCGDKKVGTGLLKCFAAYKKSHKDFKFSESCQNAKMTLRVDKQQKK